MKEARGVLLRILEVVVLTLITSLALVVVLGVVFRKAGASLVWYDEVASILLAWLTYYGAALAALHRAHIGMPTLVERLTGRMRLAVVLFGEAVTVTFFALLAWAGVRVLTVLGGTTLVSLPAVPASVAQSVIPIGAILFIVAQLLSLPDVLTPQASENAGEPGKGMGGPGTVAGESNGSAGESGAGPDGSSEVLP